MKPLESQMEEQARFEYMHEKVGYKDTVDDKFKTVKNSQFAQPLFEFSGACMGCGETPYVKAVTQLFGERMMVANATGCSSIYSGSYPSTPYTTNKNGCGPAWANSLFEDNAEFGMGMVMGVEKLRDRIEILMKQGLECSKCSDEMKALFTEWIANRDNGAKTLEIANKLIPMIEKCTCDTCKELSTLKQYIVKRSQWIIGGDGWAYDIGYGGLDHVLASGDNLNILVLDTEVYSNTGGQSSKSTPAGAVAKFATSGKRIRKKDLGMMAMSYGYVYVAQVSMGADQSQFFKVLKEAEAYNGPSLIIAYSPCINHGLKGGMGISQREEKFAVQCGYWHNYRYNPMLEAEGKNPFTLDSKEPDWTQFQNFLKNEVRYTSLTKSFPEQAQELFKATEENAKWRYNQYKRLAGKE
jgi:pyruvate-ferredoxin/flavodoxin oxidoreductase